MVDKPCKLDSFLIIVLEIVNSVQCQRVFDMDVWDYTEANIFLSMFHTLMSRSFINSAFHMWTLA